MKARRDGQILSQGERKWLVRWYIGVGADGKKRYKSEVVHGAKKAAQARLNAVLHSRGVGEYVEPSKVTVNAYLDRWLRTGATGSPRTREGYRWYLQKYVRPVIGDMRLDKLDVPDVQEIVSRMVADEYASRTVHIAVAVLSRACRQAIKWKLLPRNPVAGVALPKKTQSKTRALSAEEVGKLRVAIIELRDESLTKAAALVEDSPYLAARAEGEAARWSRAAVLLDVLLWTGLRPGEALGLRWSDVDLDAGRLTVRRALTWVPDAEALTRNGNPKPRAKFADPKTEKSRRTLPLGSTLVRALAAHKAAQAERAMKLGDSYERTPEGKLELVFANEIGRPLDERNVAQRDLVPALKRAKIEGRVRLYDLRHTSASLLLAAGESVKVVSERLGHASAAMTLNVYAHVLPGAQEEATARIENVILGE
jgi:integrase